MKPRIPTTNNNQEPEPFEESTKTQKTYCLRRQRGRFKERPQSRAAQDLSKRPNPKPKTKPKILIFFSLLIWICEGDGGGFGLGLGLGHGHAVLLSQRGGCVRWFQERTGLKREKEKRRRHERGKKRVSRKTK